jgi:signal transduction histidine kinase
MADACHLLDELGAMLPMHQRTAEDSEKDAVLPAIGANDRVAHPQPGLRELTHALALREEAMGILGHELRNPLSAIVALARATMGSEGLPAEARERLAHMDRAARRSLSMIEVLLDFGESRWRGPLDIRVVASDLAAIAAEVVEETRAANPGRVIELEACRAGSFVVDPLRIAQVLANLIGNALVHGFPHTPVRVTVEICNGEALLAVRNHGPVIPPDQVSTLFEPFTRAGGGSAERDVTAIRTTPGLGLGLYIVRTIVHAHGGSIEVVSDVESGTSFLVRLPQRGPNPHQDRS